MPHAQSQEEARTPLTATARPPGVLRPRWSFYLELHARPGAVRRGAAYGGRASPSGWSGGLHRDARQVGGHGVVGRAVQRRRPDGHAAGRTRRPAGAGAHRSAVREPNGPEAMHACGHDLHRPRPRARPRCSPGVRDTWSGTVLVVGQPAEEDLDRRRRDARGRSVRAVRPAGRGARPALRAAAGRHGRPRARAADGRQRHAGVVIHGSGGHAGAPQSAVDPVVIAAAAVLRLQTVVSRETAPAEQVVLTVGSLHAGDRANVIPDEARMSLSVRAFTDAALGRVVAAVERVVRAECAASGCPRAPEFTVISRSTPLVQHAATAQLVRRAHEEAFGAHRVTGWPGSTATEDFGHFGVDGVPIAYWILGATGARQWRAAREGTAPLPANHSPEFAPDVRNALPAGITAMAAAALRVLHARPE